MASLFVVYVVRSLIVGFYPHVKNPAKDEKKALVLANRDTGGRGKKRELQTVQSVSFSGWSFFSWAGTCSFAKPRNILASLFVCWGVVEGCSSVLRFRTPNRVVLKLALIIWTRSGNCPCWMGIHESHLGISNTVQHDDYNNNALGMQQLQYFVHVLIWYVGYEFAFAWKLSRFKKRMKKWYNFSDKECEEKWQEAVRDPLVPKGTDQWLDNNDFSVNSLLEFCEASTFANPFIRWS